MKIGWSFNSKYSFSDKKFAGIYDFYVLRTPVSNVSKRGVSFKDRSIDVGALVRNLKKGSLFLEDNWHQIKVSEVEDACSENGILENVKEIKEIAIHTASRENKTASLFYAIRCAFAHGSFSIHTYNKEKYYFIENRDGNKLKARLILKEETLLGWANLVERMTK